MIVTIRSLLFNFVFFSWTVVMMTAIWWVLLCPRRVTLWASILWTESLFWLLPPLTGIRYELRGVENLPEGPYILAPKHQSAWDTMIFRRVTGDPCYILKKELIKIPFYGWYLAKVGMISVDRNAGASALKYMVKMTQQRIAEGRRIIIFPEGTRSQAGTTGTYHPGVAAMDKAVDVPVIPVALNSGMFWGRRSFKKYPGKIVVEFLPPMEKGLHRKEFMAELENRIETATRRLEQEAMRDYGVEMPPPSPAEQPAQG